MLTFLKPSLWNWSLAVVMLLQPILAAFPPKLADAVATFEAIQDTIDAVIYGMMDDPALLIVPGAAPLRTSHMTSPWPPTGMSYDYLVDSTQDLPFGSTVDCTTPNDPNKTCTLRAAIQQANGSTNKVIAVPAGTYLLTRSGSDNNASNGDLDITAPMTIIGESAATTIIDGGGSSGAAQDRVFHVYHTADSNMVATIKNLTITRGHAGGSASGGGIRVEYASCTTCSGREVELELNGVTIHDNYAINRGGGVYAFYGLSNTNNTVRLDIDNSTISGNESDGSGGGVAIEEKVVATIDNTTISGNDSGGKGGGVFAHTNTSGYQPTITLTNVTLADNVTANSAGGGGFATNGTNATSITLTIRNTILARNKANGTVSNCNGTFTFSGNADSSLSDDPTLGHTCGSSSTVEYVEDTGVRGLQEASGGSTQVHMPVWGSAALNMGTPANCSSTDQHGHPRATTSCDIGALEMNPIPARQVAGSGMLCADPGCMDANFALSTQGMAYQSPINTRTGNLFQYSTDFSVPSQYGALSFSRSYSTANADALPAGTLGAGWNHNYDVRLIFPANTAYGGESGKILVMMPDGSRLGFIGAAAQSSYQPEPGVGGELTYSSGSSTYTYTSPSRASYTFNSGGVLQRMNNGAGQELEMIYNNNLLKEVRPVAQSGQTQSQLPSLKLEYCNGRIKYVGDQSLTYNSSNCTATGGRYFEYQYTQNSTDSVFDLTNTVDMTGNQWRYEYGDSAHPHFLTARVDPGWNGSGTKNFIAQYTYDSQDRAISATRGTEANSVKNVVDLLFNADGTTRVSDGTGRFINHEYSGNGTLSSVTNSAFNAFSMLYDPNFRPTSIADANGHVTEIAWQPSGADIETIQNAIEQLASFRYDGANRLEYIDYQDGTSTRYVYNVCTGNPKVAPYDPTKTNGTRLPNYCTLDEDLLLMEIVNYHAPSTATADQNIATYYEYTTSAPTGQINKVIYPDGVTTCVFYNAKGQVERTRENCQSDLETDYTYDTTYQRLETVVDPLGGTTTYFYDNSDNEPDRISRPDGQQMRLYRDKQGRVVWSIVNYTSSTFTDSDAQAVTIDFNGNGTSSGESFETVYLSPNEPDRNIITRYTYDTYGNTQSVIQNYWPGLADRDDITDPDFVVYNNETRYFYDSGRRIVAEIANYVADLSDVSTPETTDLDPSSRVVNVTYEISPNKPEFNQMTWNVYDEQGRLAIQRIAAWPSKPNGSGQTPGSYYDPSNPTNSSTLPIFPRYNFAVAYEYDKSDQVVKQIMNYDPTLPDSDYDFTVPVYVNSPNPSAPGASVTPTTIRVDPYVPDRNVITCIDRDFLGRPTEATEACLPGQIDYYSPTGNHPTTNEPLDPFDNLYNVPSRVYYDDNTGRVLAVVRNFLDNGTSNTDNILEVTSENNFATRVFYDGAGRIEHVVKNFNGNVLTTTVPTISLSQPDRNLVTRYFYDPVLKRHIATAHNYYDTTPSTYTSNDITSPDSLDYHLNLVRRVFYSTRGLPQTYVDNFDGDVWDNNTIPSVGNDHNLRTFYDLDEAGRLEITKLNDLRETKAITFNALGQITLLMENHVSGQSPLSDRNIDHNYVYNLMGLQERYTDPEGVVYDTVYDAAGRPIQQILDPSSLNSVSITTRYDAAGRPILTTNAEGEAAQTKFDTLGRVVETVQDPGSSPHLNLTTHYLYDTQGRVIQIMRNPVVVSPNTIPVCATGTDEQNICTRYQYDNWGRIVNIFENYDPDGPSASELKWPGCAPDIDGDNVCTHYDYDNAGNMTKLTLPNDTVTIYQYDTLGQLRFEWAKGDSSTDDTVTEYCYDHAGYVVQIIKGSLVSYSSSSTAINNSLCAPTDSGLNVIYQSTRYKYDAAGRLTEITYRTPGSGATYVAAANVKSTYTSFGERITMDDTTALGRWAFRYDAVGRMEAVCSKLNVSDVTTVTALWSNGDCTGDLVEYTYDQAGKRDTLAMSGTASMSLDYDYDTAGRLWKISNPFETSYKVLYEYDRANRVTSVCPRWNATCSGIASAYDYDAASRLISIDHTKTTTGDIASYDYKYDVFSNRTDVVETVNFGTIASLPGSRLFGNADPNTQSAQTTASEVTDLLNLGFMGVSATGYARRATPATTPTLPQPTEALPNGQPAAPQMPATPAGASVVGSASDDQAYGQPATCTSLFGNNNGFAAAMGQQAGKPLTSVDGQLIAEQASYRASFAQAGIRFTGMKNGQAESGDLLMALQTEGQSHQAAWQDCENIAFRPVGEGMFEMVASLEDGIRTGYLLRTNPLRPNEQTDLRLDIALETDLQPVESSEGLLLLDEQGEGVLVTDAKVIDSSGRELAIDMQFEQGKLVLTVPKSWLDTADFPVLVDPKFVRWTTSGTVHRPIVALDDAENQALVLYKNNVSTDNVYLRFINTTTGDRVYTSQDNVQVAAGTWQAAVFNPGSSGSNREFLIAYVRSGTIYARRVLDDGNSITAQTEQTVITGRTNVARLSLAMNASGRALLVWEDEDSGDTDVRGIFLNANGTPDTIVGDFYIAQSSSDDESHADVTYDSNVSRFVVAYRTGTSSTNAYVISVTTTGGLGSSAYSLGAGNLPSVAFNDDTDETLVVWRNGDNLYGHRLLVNSSTGAISVPTATDYSQIKLKTPQNANLNPDVAFNPAGGWVVAWENDDPTSGTDIWITGIAEDAKGTQTTEPIPVTREDYDQENPSLAVRSTGAAMVVAEDWNSTHTTSTVMLILNAGSFTPETAENTQFAWHYEYDRLQRLTSACSKWDDDTDSCLGNLLHYEYDGAGNMTRYDRWDNTNAEVITTRFIYNQSNQIKCIDAAADGSCSGDTVWVYDAFGNLTDDGPTTYTYDAANRLVTVADGTKTTNYAYNGDSARMSQTVNSTTTTTYVIDFLAPYPTVLAEKTGSTVTLFWHGLGLLAQSKGGTVHYVMPDANGSVRQLITSGGSVQRRQTFDPFGSLYTGSSSSGTVSAFGYTGQYSDGNGLLYLRTRYYSPQQGRFFQRDLWPGMRMMPQSQHPYAYVMNNPVRYADPSGMSFWSTLTGAISSAVSTVSNVVSSAVNTVSNVVSGAVSTVTSVASSAVNTVSNLASDVGSTLSNVASTAVAGPTSPLGVSTQALNYGMDVAQSPDPVAKVESDARNLAAKPFEWGLDRIDTFNRWIGAGVLGPVLGRPDTSAYYAGRPDRYFGDLFTNTDTVMTLTEIIAPSPDKFFGAAKYSDEALSYSDEAAQCIMNSFSADTPVATKDGNKPISDVEVGDEVLAYNEETGEVGEYTVTDAFSHVDEVIIELNIDGETIYTTPEHPFYTDDGEWEEAGDLVAGEYVMASDGTYGKVFSMYVIEDVSQRMYNLTVDEAHTFFVGEREWLVHNCDPELTVIGSWEDEYIRVADEFNANYYNVPSQPHFSMDSPEFNMQWVDDIANRGDYVMMTRTIEEVDKASRLFMEIERFQRHGYTLLENWLLPPIP